MGKRNNRRMEETFMKELPTTILIETHSQKRRVDTKDYIKAKTLDLIEFGYNTLTEKEVEDELIKILNKDTNLTVIGHFIKDDICMK